MRKRAKRGFNPPTEAEQRRIPWDGPGPDPRLADEKEPPEPPSGEPTWPREIRFRHKRVGDFRAFATDRAPVMYGEAALLPTSYTLEPLVRRGRGEPPPAPPALPIALDIDASTGQPRCIGIRAVGVAELTGEMLRGAPIGELMDQATYAMARPAKPFRVAPDLWSFERIDELAQAMAAQNGPGSRTPRATIERVAAIYVEAKQNGEHPTKAVAARLPCSRPHAGRLVMQTRRLGLIPPP